MDMIVSGTNESAASKGAQSNAESPCSTSFLVSSIRPLPGGGFLSNVMSFLALLKSLSHSEEVAG